MGDATHRKPRGADASAVCGDRRCDRNERELIGSAVSDFKIMRGARIHACGHFDGDDQIASIKDIVTLGRPAWKAMEVCERNLSFACFSPHDHERIYSCKRDRKIGRVRRHAGLQTIRKSRDCD